MSRAVGRVQAGIHRPGGRVRAGLPASQTALRSRSTTNGRALQPEAECPVCRTMVRQKLATGDESGQYARTPGTDRGDLILGQHRFGGGNVSLRNGDAPCAGALSKVS